MRGVVFAMVLAPVMVDERPVGGPPATAVAPRLMDPERSRPPRPRLPWVEPMPPWAGDPGIFIPRLSPGELPEPPDAIRERPEVIPLAFEADREVGHLLRGIP